MIRLAPFLFLLAAPPRVLAGVGGSAVSLAACAPAATAPQSWRFSAASQLQLFGDAAPLWGTTWCLAVGQGIDAAAALAGAPLYTSPCGAPGRPGGGLVLSPPAPGGARSPLALADGSGLCVSVAAPGALPGAMLELAACEGGASPPDSQAFALAAGAGGGALVHAATGLCVDAGTRAPPPCEAGARGAGLPFCNASLPVDARVADLIGRLSLEEKARMLATMSGGAAGEGLGPSQWWNEALHGVANNVGVFFDEPTPAATAFPQPITSSCAFNRSLWLATGQAVSEEMRAFANVGHAGLTAWSPNINLVRDPRWGRIQETPGEDVMLSGAYAEQFVRGMQEGADPRFIKVSACCKHFVAYSLESWHGVDRHHFDARVSDEDLAEFYLPAFQACVERGRASAMMCSYNAVNGVPSCASSFLMNEVARSEWKLDGYITSDCAAVSDILLTVRTNPAGSAGASVFAGAAPTFFTPLASLAPRHSTTTRPRSRRPLARL